MNLDNILIGVDVFTFISSCVCMVVLYYDTKKLVRSTAKLMDAVIGYSIGRVSPSNKEEFKALQELAEQRLHYRKKFKV